MAQRRPPRRRYSPARRRRRLVVVALVLAVAIPGALLVALAAGGSGGGERPALTVAALEAYQDAVHPPLADGGKVVEQGMKPAVQTLADPAATPAALAAVATSAEGWGRDLGDVRARVAAVPPPPGLATASAGFDRALALYLEAARALGRAARAPGSQRQGILDTAVDAARQADATYDDASQVLQDARRGLGLEPTSQFPDPTREPSPSAT